MAEDPLDKKARGQLLAPSVTASAHTAFPELRADRLYYQPRDEHRPLSLTLSTAVQAQHAPGEAAPCNQAVTAETIFATHPAA
jgi:hypothetical protein